MKEPRRTSPDFSLMERLVPAPGDSPDWNAVSSVWSELAALSSCPQDPVHHAEGDVGTHTRMVLDELAAAEAWRSLPAERRSLLFWAAALHDVGKPGTTAFEPGGRITSAGHSRLGASIARRLLWEAGAPVPFREELCGLVAAHQAPFWLFERDDQAKAACRIALSCRPSDLLTLAAADARGRKCADPQDIADRVELSRLVFEDLGILGSPYPFANGESRYAFFEKDGRPPEYAAHEDFRCEATLVCGLPGTGKDTWIGANLGGMPVVSLDGLRAEMGIGHGDNQGTVVQAALERAREHLRAGRDFAWNAVNVTRQNRGKVTRLLRDYGARIRIVYLEVSPETLFRQNGSRKASVPVDAILRLARKLEPPHADEAHEVCWIADGERVHSAGCAEPAASPAP